MDKYKVLLTNKAIYDIDNIYDYITNDLSVSSPAIGIVNNIEEAILSLEYLPTRGSIRKVGNFTGKNYRQLFVGSYQKSYPCDMAFIIRTIPSQCVILLSKRMTYKLY